MTGMLHIQPLPFLRNNTRNPPQAIRVQCTAPPGAADQRWTLRTLRGSWHEEFHLQGEDTQTVFLPEPNAPIDTTFIGRWGEEQEAILLRMQPVRRWTVHLVLHSHTDLGFTAPVSDVAEIHNRNTDRAIEFCRETRHLPEGVRFRWTCEVAWQVQNYIRDRTPEQVAALMQLVREGEIGVGALYSGELTELLGHEEATRCFAYAGFLRRHYGIPCDTAMLCDVPGCTRGLVQIMAKSGVSSLVVADNNFMAPFLLRNDLPRPFFWKGDDNTEVLCWFTDHPFYAYVEGEYYGFLDRRERVERMLGDKLLALEHDGYPYDRFQIQYAFDNAPLTFTPADIVREWTTVWEYPKIVLSTAREFLAAMRTEHGAGIRRRAGDWNNWWGGIVTGFPVDEALARQYHERTPAIELLSSCLRFGATRTPTPDPGVARVYDGLLAFDEHSGGGNLWQPKSRAEQDRALREGYGFLHNAIGDLDGCEASTLKMLEAHAIQPAGENHIGIYNPSGVAVSRDIEITKPGEPARTFLAHELPPYGYRLYPSRDLGSAKGSRPPAFSVTADQKSVRLENASCSVVIDRRSGLWVSYLDKHAPAELVPPGEALNAPCVYVVHPVCPIELGKYIPQLYDGTSHPGTFLPWPPSSVPSVTWSEVSPGTVACTVEHRIQNTAWLIQEYRLTAHAPGVSIVNTLIRKSRERFDDIGDLKRFLHPGGMLYFRFPFALDHAHAEYEAPCTIVQPAEEQFRGSCHDFVAVQRWCALRSSHGGVLLTVPDTPLVDIGSVGLHRFKERLDEYPSTLFVRAITLRDWGSQDESPYTRGRNPFFRFGVSFLSDGLPDGAAHESSQTFRARAHRRAVQDTAPLFCFVPNTGSQGTLSGNEHRFLILTPDTVEVMTAKPWEAGNGWIVRLREVTGTATDARISFPGFLIHSCRLATITEEILAPHPHAEDEVVIPCSPFAIVTLLLELKPRDLNAC